MMRRFFRYWAGRHRLYWGFCPRCDSSPPDRACPICEGSYAYGRARLTDSRRAQWRARWDAAFGR